MTLFFDCLFLYFAVINILVIIKLNANNCICLISCEIFAQAIERVHRIGQQKPVFVHRFIVRDSVEERMVELKAHKTQLALAVADAGDPSLEELDVDSNAGIYNHDCFGYSHVLTFATSFGLFTTFISCRGRMRVMQIELL